MNNHTFIIAEAGSCHDGQFRRALDLIQVAKAAEADACKFQYWSSPERLAERRNAADYLDVYRRYQMPREWLEPLAAQCAHDGLEFMCTTYLPEDIPVVAPFVKRFKVASFEAGDERFLQAHTVYQKPLIVSTGMSGGLLAVGVPYPTEVLHCVSSYPAPLDQANLGVLRNPAYAGYSDHTRHVLTGAFAVCAGARILEVHFRLDDTDTSNPDYGTALSPSELGEYVANVRLAERMMGDGVKKPQPAEADMMRYRVWK